jgi:hypothetical protein
VSIEERTEPLTSERVDEVLATIRAHLDLAEDDEERVEIVEDLIDWWYRHWPATAVTSPSAPLARELVRLLRPSAELEETSLKVGSLIGMLGATNAALVEARQQRRAALKAQAEARAELERIRLAARRISCWPTAPLRQFREMVESSEKAPPGSISAEQAYAEIRRLAALLSGAVPVEIRMSRERVEDCDGE